MARRLNKTLIDYLVIAISPALIMLLVGSLVFFLIQVFYQGNFGGRVEWVFFWFVMAAVLIGRIAIEEGWERAMLFALPLALAVLVVLGQFMQVQGWWAPLSFLVNAGLIALVWWSANKLTWDCTLIDEQEEDSGEGLLETVGLDTPDRESLQREITPVLPEPEGITSRDVGPQGWWDRFVDRRHRPHAPGVWVVYFSLAALPLFGIGQLFIPNNKPEVRQYAFCLLFVYTASGLGLLLSTSFLGLRRYLRQRKQEMPLMMVNLWLGIGAALIAGVMLLALLLPRPNAEYAISEIPIHIGSPDQHSSRYGMGRDGVKENRPQARPESREGQPVGAAKGAPSGKVATGDKKEGPAGDKTTSKQKGANGPSQSGKKDESAAKSPSPDQTNKGSQDNSKPSPDGKASAKSKDAKKTPTGQNAGKKSPDNSQAAAKKSPDAASSRQQSSSQPPPAPPPSAPPPVSLPAMAWLVILLKWLFYAAVAGLIGYWLWKNWETVRAALVDLWKSLLDLWHSLFGGKAREEKAVATDAAPKPAPLPRFADFTDPFASGTAASYRPEELVRYTFDALEAWARDNGHPRGPEQTPHEFTRVLGSHVASVAEGAGRLAELYCQVAYAARRPPTASVARLSNLWQTLRDEADAPQSAGVA